MTANGVQSAGKDHRMRYYRVLIAAAISFLLGTGGIQTVVAQQAAPARPANNGTNNEISINFDNAPILEVIDVMSRVTGKNFIIDPVVKGNVTVVAPKRIPKEEAYGIFESILELNGFSLVPVGDIIKVVPSKAATQRSIPVGTGRESQKVSKRDQFVTQLIPIKYSDAQAIVSVLTPLVSRDASITPYINTNTIILTETSSNINRLLQIVQEIDVPGFEETITIITLTNAQASVLAQEILQALEPSATTPGAGTVTPRTRRRQPTQAAVTGAPGSQVKIIPDERTNSLIVVANELDTEQVRFLAKELDKTTPIEANNIHVYRLQNSLAEEVAAVLTSLASTTTPATAPAAGAAAVISGIRTFYKEITVVADKTTNSLIITATPQDYVVIKGVIEQLDVMRPQVLVETLIAEVNLDFSRDLGVQWLAANPHGRDHGFIGVGEDTRDSSLAEAIAAALAAGGAVSPPSGLSVGYANIDSNFLRAFVEINASEGNSNFNVLSAPHVLTLDNEKATINISRNVPFITGRVRDTGEAAVTASSETFEFRDVGIILEITPHISPDRMVRLEIVQKVNDVATVDASGTTTDVLSEIKREAETTLMVKDRNTLVLGGLMKDTDNTVEGKVPFLGDIPVLGWAFKNKSIIRTKTNLLIFITPSIVTTVAEAGELTCEKGGEVEEHLLEQLGEAPCIRRSRTFNPPAAEFNVPEEDLLEAGPK